MSSPRLHDPAVRGFASDNAAGAHPEVLDALRAANDGHVGSYGGDPYTAALAGVVRRHFGEAAEVHPVLSGTGANVVALQALTRRWESVVCARGAHVDDDEGGAPEHVGGMKLLTLPAADGKVTPDALEAAVRRSQTPMRAPAGALSLTQSTEVGTCYTPEETAALTRRAHDLGLRVHLDGARLANAAAALGTDLRALTTDAGVDAVSLGATKNGALLADAVVVCAPDAAEGVERLRKQSLQLASKMRFVSAQLLALLADDLWLRSARHANAMAARLADAVREVPGVEISRPVQVNAVFAALPEPARRRLQERFAFHVWDEPSGEVRWMTAFDTTAEDVDTFAAAVAEEVRRDLAPGATRGAGA
ncbi:L-threonine aldolase [Kineococcus xinjiangensis]|uniref:L-threonine aldolase n=1 Tax=Kineococcus xinjiangensis TaxID=512762 RepID=A0A2S6IWN3_9ACTN|nr:beta-eliminating lyase-related protein [Kineococcus xinjiangensis]PPK98650.1 L-threonine aldolase [Kineococcus xinjiangensis]